MAHRNARLTPHGRLLLCERIEIGGWKVREAAAAAGVSRQTAGKWLARWRAEGAAGLLDRSSRPLRIALRVVGALLRRVVLLRLTRRRGPAWIAWRTDLAPATVYRALQAPPPAPPARRSIRRSRWCATAGRTPATSCTSTPRSWGASAPAAASASAAPQGPLPRHRLELRPRGRRRRHPARLRRGARRRARRDRGRLPRARPGLLRCPRHRGASACSPTTAAATARRLSPRRQSSKACGSGTPGPTGRRRTARRRRS